ncbi:DUF4861 domain-containing protein [Saccharobesus litoralis]|uniref:DUF4861 domain-containing protein n=1 Tax=Saccharobesus litoralis TaxID=2172099 RepID=A0A2S0VPG6_9ALTE|nr:DUF4861 family protein [Saccharobesus litoralis]AWB66108.1 DUF4861 domain-containing protein [Saccharobesus litoralis]
MYKFSFLHLLVASVIIGCNATTPLSSQDQQVEVASATKSTYARYVPERKDDFAWENDLVAFRAYGPAARAGAENAGVDCWLKRVDYPIINKWYKLHFEQGKSYHEDHGEGLDNYHVGSSAGCGGTSLWLNGQREPLETWTKWQILEQTKEKTKFKLFYERDIAGKTYQEEKLITIELGQRLYSVSSRFLVDGQPAPSLAVTVGVTTHDGKAQVKTNKDKGWIATWENLDGYGLGTAVVVNPESVVEFKTIDSNGVKDAGHALILLNTNSQGEISYKAGYGWQKAKAIETFSQWQNYLNNHK